MPVLPGTEPTIGQGPEFKPSTPKLDTDSLEAQEAEEVTPPEATAPIKASKAPTAEPMVASDAAAAEAKTPAEQLAAPPIEQAQQTTAAASEPAEPSNPNLSPETTGANEEEAPHGIRGFFKKLLGHNKAAAGNNLPLVSTEYVSSPDKPQDIKDHRKRTLNELGGESGVISSADRYKAIRPPEDVDNEDKAA